jgi:NAD(P)-dependent dehydrogenase (short-subunit alcohol dehydrogenase family)
MPKRVLIFGCAGGIGAHVASRLARDGYEVIGSDCHKACGGAGISSYLPLDLRCSENIVSTCSIVTNRHSPLWAIVFCAGIYPITSLDDYTTTLWDNVNVINVGSCFHLIQLLRDDIETGGRIVLVTSGAASLGSRDVGYSASKAGLAGLARGLVRNLAPRNILVNTVSPGIIDTPMSARMAKGRIEDYLEWIPLRRIGKPSEVACCVSFLLASDNTYMTGACLDVNGGLYIR